MIRGINKIIKQSINKLKSIYLNMSLLEDDSNSTNLFRFLMFQVNILC
jgi:hypothetical protein